ncbi:hypothetical protein [Mycolicibacterium elephantis]|uniref:hypothetical protein n=1 Tax=Mycolicibacterium elephantis TaxID=81858 RepID=UPI0013E3837F|nr:hypothetical protein [Mycolicibacterium elephantis]MCV7221513.1 hypothetical protein [Mycolicibacterium elephantis]
MDGLLGILVTIAGAFAFAGAVVTLVWLLMIKIPEIRRARKKSTAKPVKRSGTTVSG